MSFPLHQKKFTPTHKRSVCTHERSVMRLAYNIDIYSNT